MRYTQDPVTGRTTSELVDVAEHPQVLTRDDTPPRGHPRDVGHLKITPRAGEVQFEVPNEGRQRDAQGPSRIETVRYVHDLDTGEETREVVGRATARPGTDAVSLVSRLKSLIATNRAEGGQAPGAAAGSVSRRPGGGARSGMGRKSSRRQEESARADQGYEVNMTVRYEDPKQAKPKAPRPRRRLHEELFG